MCWQHPFSFADDGDGRAGRAEPQLHLLKSINAENMVKLSTARHVNLDDQIFKTIQTGLRMVVSDEEVIAVS